MTGATAHPRAAGGFSDMTADETAGMRNRRTAKTVDDRRAGGLIPGAVILPRNSLEWRCDPLSHWRHPAITSWDQQIILVCQEGFQSSLAAAVLHQLGLVNATDLDGGFAAWTAAGLPVVPAAE